MATHDAAVIAALARHIVLARDLLRDDAEAVAEAHGMDAADVVEAVGWFRAIAEPRYRGSPALAAASKLATRLRHPVLIKPSSELRPANVATDESTAAHVDTVDPDRPERPCARCQTRFRPTMRRRLLCTPCYADDSHDSRVGLSALRAAT